MGTKLFRRYSVIDGINPNILHNAYFRGGGSQQTGDMKFFPINQRRWSTYTNTGTDPIYTIDRWIMSPNAELSFTSGPADAIRLTKKTAGETVWLAQKLENLNRGVQTFSALVRVNLKGNGTTDAGKFYAAVKSENGSELNSANFFASITTEPALIMVNYWNESNISVKSVEFRLDADVPVNGYVDILACKLELGDRQTLVHCSGGKWVLTEPPPDHSIELMKCMRYLQMAPESLGHRVDKGIYFRPPLACSETPDYGQYQIGSGARWLYWSAEP